jgi:hypothetical protein
LLNCEALFFEKAFGDGDAVRKLVVPGEADENDAQIFLFLGLGWVKEQDR